MIGRKLAGHIFRDREELWGALQVAVHDIPPEQVIGLYRSLPDRMDAVIQARGRHTPY